MSFILHAQNFGRIPLTGRWIQRRLQARCAKVGTLVAGLPDPDISVVIRSRNDGAFIKQLFADIRAQEFNGRIEVIVVDTTSTDNTVVDAKAQGAKIIHLTQAAFTYPVALNVGFRAAKYPYVVTLVGHSNLSNRMMFRSLTYWCQQEKFGGVYSWPLVNRNGSRWERWGSVWWPLFLGPRIMQKASSGMLGANCSIVKRQVWEQLGGYDERYAGGGEDTALARSMLMHGFVIAREPLCSVFHSHGLSVVNNLKQSWHWLQIGRARPQPFDAKKVHARRPDLRD
ncbi:MAG TPA: glycosyltransferase [Nevskiaceae bacterium]|nr:glycosyltransferase [Nevskiaceae bacterium]